ncbi:ribonuclease P/MRP protein subunit POP5-like [Denticeps clupeoides]|uniref:ribonuclease P/MRP protein subunit POP5-like n=1 Tax=Denticeps clupeoides TaxID=299321 RepID=UPI0010A57CA1|nr:ribonuclease P/MRP protein subunit POP5-like [Denticeps clupeoides]
MVKFKSRFLLCGVTASKLPGTRVALQALRETVARTHGDYGMAALQRGFCVMYVNANTGIMLLRCQKSHYRLIWSALTFFSSFKRAKQEVQCSFSCVHVGGTMRTCQRFLEQYRTQWLHRMPPECKTDGETLSFLLSTSHGPSR